MEGILQPKEKPPPKREQDPCVEANESPPDDGSQSINKLLGGSINAEDIKNLKAAGFYTIASIAFALKKSLIVVKGISNAKAEGLMQAANRFINIGFSSASHFQRKRSEIIRIRTGSTEIDKILAGGIETGSITELFGEFGTGKTQLCHTLAVTCQMPVSEGGVGGKCIFVDTYNTFRSERLVANSDRFGLNKVEVLNNVITARAYTTDHLTELVTKAGALMIESRFALLVVDSVTSLYRAEYSGLSELAARQQYLGQLLRKLLHLADEFGIAIVITNEVLTQVNGFTFGEQKTPIGGNVLAHASTTRLSLRKGLGNTRYLKIYHSPTLPEAEVRFCITTLGVDDTKDVV